MVRRRYWLKKKVKEAIEKEEEPHHKESHEGELKPKPSTTSSATTGKIKFHETKVREKKKVENVGSKEAEAEIKKMNKNFFKLKSQEDR